MQVEKYSYVLGAELLRVAVLALLSILIWCTIMNRWSVTAWQTPLEYVENPATSGDAPFYFAAVKAAAGGHYRPLFAKKIPELGAPFGAQWNDYPTVEELLIFFTGLLARFVGLFAACNFMTMLAHLLAAVSMYAACRLLRCQWSWSFAVGLAFGFATYAFAHGEHHLDVTYYWHVPLCLLVSRWLTVSEGLAAKGWRFWFALAVAFLTGLQNQYYTFMFIQLAALGGLVQWLRRDWRAVLPALAVCASAMAGFALVNVDTLIFQFLHGPNPAAVVRYYSQMEFYALKIADLFIPFPGHRFFSHLAEYYFANVLIRGETPPAAYLGLVGIIGLFALAIVTFVRLTKTPPAAVPLEGAQTLWILLQSTVGGINGLLGVFGFQLFRSTNRYSIFILALALIFMARRLSALTVNHRLAAAGGAVLLAVIALIDQTPRIASVTEIQQIAQTVRSDETFVREIESRLPSAAMIFQLPIIEFPEASPSANVSAYEHFRPYLFARHLRFSYGSDKGRPRDDWPRDLGGLSLSEAIDTLERYGFAAICVSRNGFEDKGEGLFQQCQEAGRGDIVQSPLGDLFCVFLRPSPNPVLPSRKSNQ